MHDNIDHYDIYKADGCIKKVKMICVFSLLIMGAIIYETYNALLRFIHFLIMEELDRTDLTFDELNTIEDIINNRSMIAAVITAILGAVFILVPLIRTLVTISKCSAASRDFNSTGDTLKLAECALYLRKKYTKTVVFFFVFVVFFISSSSMNESVMQPVIVNIDLGFLLLFLPSLFHTAFASKALRLCGDAGRTVPVRTPHNDRCGEKDHHYDYVSGEQKDCYGKHKYDSYSEYESYSDDYDYFANDDRFKIDMSRYDFSNYTDTDKH